MPYAPLQSFSASYDSTVKVISAAVAAILIVATAAAHSVIAGCFGFLVLALTYAYSPRGYAISERTLAVRRLIGDVTVPLAGLREARMASADDFRGCLRLWGNGGLFGYYGLFQTTKLGRSWWYVTNRSKAVVLVAEEKTVLVSPDDGPGFLSAIHSAAPASGMAQAASQSAEPYTGGGAAKWLGAGIAVAVLAFVGLALLYAPGPPRCTLTPDSLTIHDRFYPVTLHPADVDVAHIRVVDLDADPDWRPVARTNGFANAHYRSGWFRVAGGQKVRMYQADARRLCLLPPKGSGAAVLLEVPEPEKFAQQLRQAWARPS